MLRAKAKARGLHFIIESAGAGGWHQGDPADARMTRAAARRGYRLDRHRARQVILGDYRSFDILLAKDLGNHADVLAMAPTNRDCDIRLVPDFAGGGARETLAP